MKYVDENKESSYPMSLDVNNLHGWAMSQKLSVNNFKWKICLKSNENFIKTYDKNSDKGYILEVDVKNLKDLKTLTVVYHFYQKE